MGAGSVAQRSVRSRQSAKATADQANQDDNSQKSSYLDSDDNSDNDSVITALLSDCF